jgi:hypothetical protein
MSDEHITGLTGWFQGGAISCPEDGSLLEVSGTYCIYTQRLTPEEVAALERIFEQLPGISEGANDPPWDYLFYGSDDSAPQILTTSFEPSGIVVHGRLTTERWQEWDSTFRRLVDLAALPRFHE